MEKRRGNGERLVCASFAVGFRVVGLSPTVVVSHGWGSNRSRVLRYVHPLHREGYSVLVYNVRSHGDSDSVKAPSGLLFRDDLQSALRYLEGREDVDKQRIGVLGHSLGGFGAVLALDEGAPIRALVTDSMPVRFATMVEAELRRRKLPAFPLAHIIPEIMVRRSRIPSALVKRANPAAILEDNASGKRVPVMLVHSRGDSIIPPAELNHVLARVPDANHLFVDVDGHSASEQDPAFWPAVTGFFKEYLSIREEAVDKQGDYASV
ncbi:alpha/beta fold hydrolase [Cohnella faecalis]|uniref:Alpha/beta fold hydrolase n=1 Tax=Cohnella faecalis TaxID=2315694 RepID=A0A398CR72_9BACL|nr:alpha/beta fold hydrolase [Cohnella faecalis]